MLRLGTRKSALAWAQSGHVAAAIGPDVERVGMVTAGDQIVDAPLRGPLQKGWFTDELERALRAGEIDLAVHSLKDLPVQDPQGLTIGAIPKRAPASDLLLVREAAVAGGRFPVRAGGKVGAAAHRRHALLRTLAPDVEVAWLRGNVTTRIHKLADGQYDAILLAEAGVRRLGDEGRIPDGVRVFRLLPQHWPPAPGQGALAVQCRADDAALLARLALLHDPATADAVHAERAWLTRLGGGCSVPFGAYSAGDWALGVERDGLFRIARGTGAGAEAALDALVAGDAGQDWPDQIWEEADVGA